VVPGDGKQIEWDWGQDIAILDMSRLQFAVVVVPLTVLRITSTPSGLDVFVDGSGRGSTPFVTTAIAPGRHRLEVRDPQGRYRDIQDDVSLVSGDTLSLVATVQRRFACRVWCWSAIGASAGAFTWYGVQATRASEAFDEYAAAATTATAVAARNDTESARAQRDIAFWTGVGAAAFAGALTLKGIFWPGPQGFRNPGGNAPASGITFLIDGSGGQVRLSLQAAW
jgi:hypothetical protein